MILCVILPKLLPTPKQWHNAILTRSILDLSRQDKLNGFSQKLWFGRENIWRKVVHFNYLMNISSKYLREILADDTVKKFKVMTLRESFNLELSRWHHLLTFSQKLTCGWENIWRKVVHIEHDLNNVSSNNFQNMFSGSSRHCQKNPKWGRLNELNRLLDWTYLTTDDRV
jgi:hypothetical protein